MRASRFGSARHLAERFFGALSKAGPAAEDERWALDQLLPGERELWLRMSGPDRRHAVLVARETLRRLLGEGIEPGRQVLAGALLHDVGKIEAQLGTFARVGVTVAAVVLGRERLASSREAHARRSGLRSGARLYLAHDRVGGELLRGAGSDPFTVAWAEQHHLDRERWTIDRQIGDALKAADGS
jgi:hypothetical protein